MAETTNYERALEIWKGQSVDPPPLSRVERLRRLPLAPEDAIDHADQIVAREVGESGAQYSMEWKVSGESFLTEPGPLTQIPVDVITDHMLEAPALTTGGGTSDARFIKDICPVLEFGLVGDTMHQTDERVPVADIRKLSEIYLDILRRFFGT